ncbi:TIGR01777 family oxidoreductase [Fibrella forsythiae]|uniref:TIGR01777 family oxidoreductase n=1 Tax=Fibrella forsythiae TaxID=2817061 RepID=A0ABS3JHR2_9BACT|nr:TIGR01777 family oxidoreductase [Fibrella forsythiae]MBO0949505.1 TIGR01777 family oxidoreductase [Fibrella forsythiae]
METVLITGGTGTIGRRLTQLLQQQGYTVTYLSRSAHEKNGVKSYLWDIDKAQLDIRAIQTADHIIHLAGAGVADSRWTDARKREILDSRTKSTALLASALKDTQHHVKSFVASSAIGYYGGDTGDRPLRENSPAGSDFLAQVTRTWERSVEAVAALGIRTVRIRTGVVLTMDGGALPKLVQPIKLGVGAPIASGQQYISWIHIDDLCRLFIEAMKNGEWNGVYNGVAPKPITNADLTHLIAKVLDKPQIMPNIPAFVIKLMFGELAVTVLGGSYVLNRRVADETSFQYTFPDIRKALDDLL